MILHSCGVLQYNSRFARAGFVALLAVDCVKGWVRPRSGLLRGMLHHSRGDLLFSLFKGFPALPAPITAPIHEKNTDLKWTVMEHIKVLFWLWCLLMVVVWGEGYWEDNPHVKCSLWNPVRWFNQCIQLYSEVGRNDIMLLYLSSEFPGLCNSLKRIVHPKMKIHSISTHPYADVRMGEDFQFTKHSRNLNRKYIS